MFGLDTILKLTEQSIFMSTTALWLEFDLSRLELFQYTVPTSKGPKAIAT